MQICYDPHDTHRFPDIAGELDRREAFLYIRDHYEDLGCHFQKQSNGQWCLDLKIDGVDGKFTGRCGAVVFQASVSLCIKNLPTTKEVDLNQNMEEKDDFTTEYLEYLILNV